MGDAKRRRGAEAYLAKNEALQAAVDPTARALIEAMKGQLLIVLVNRLGGKVRVPVAEIDATGDAVLSVRVEGSDFIFVAGKKH